MIVPWYISFTKMFFILLCSGYTTTKIYRCANLNNVKKSIILASIIVNAILYSKLKKNIQPLYSHIISYLLITFVFSWILNLTFHKTLNLMLISIGMSYVSICIATAINFIFIIIMSLNLREQNVLEYLSIGCIQFILLYLFFKIRRFKDGFSFLNKDDYSNKSNYIGIIIGALIILISIIYSIYDNNFLGSFLVAILIVISILMFNWIRNSITKYYKEKMKEKTVELQAEQLKEKDEIIKNLKEELAKVLKINHKYNHRLSAMEKAVLQMGDKLNCNEEFSAEYSDVLDSLKALSAEYRTELLENVNVGNMQRTNIFSIDNLLQYMSNEAKLSNIDVEVEINGDIKYMIDNVISTNRLETLLADHIKDAIIAINTSNTSNRKIKVIIGKIDEVYKVCVLDTGVEFCVDTLLKLGLEQVTTHKETGGTGLGFVTTFETLKQCGASLIIEEFEPQNELKFTKAVIIEFNNKNEYIIKSYRTNKIKTNDDRIIVKELKNI